MFVTWSESTLAPSPRGARILGRADAVVEGNRRVSRASIDRGEAHRTGPDDRCASRCNASFDPPYELLRLRRVTIGPDSSPLPSELRGQVSIGAVPRGFSLAIIIDLCESAVFLLLTQIRQQSRNLFGISRTPSGRRATQPLPRFEHRHLDLDLLAVDHTQVFALTITDDFARPLTRSKMAVGLPRDRGVNRQSNLTPSNRASFWPHSRFSARAPGWPPP